ncbi:hypothetical protein BGZ72_000310 [Mortierella alpina]|nr:hypothetical protein BGZ72_000310 [Mortierella alpina]
MTSPQHKGQAHRGPSSGSGLGSGSGSERDWRSGTGTGTGTGTGSGSGPETNSALGADASLNATPNAGWTSSLRNSWRSFVPTSWSTKTGDDDESTMVDPDPRNHQVTDYEEGERRDINGNLVRFPQATRDEQPDLGRVGSHDILPNPALPADEPDPAAMQTISTPSKGTRDENLAIQEPLGNISASKPEEVTVKEAADKAVASISKAVSKHKKATVVLPDYYEQFPDLRPSLLLTVPVGASDLTLSTTGTLDSKSTLTDVSMSGRAIKFMRSAASAVGAVLSFQKPHCFQPKASQDTLQRGTYGIRKVVIIGVHGWYPRKALRTLIGEPTGTSQKFCQEMDLALKDYLRHHGKHLDPKDVTLIPLEGEGKVLERVEVLYQNLVQNKAWKEAVHEADVVLVATHSQGTPTSILLMARLIDEGLLRVKEDDPQMQRIGILTMAGISHGPFPFLKGNFVVRVFEREAASELFEFMDSETGIARKYREGLRTVLSSGVRLTCVASLEDQVVPLYSAVMTSVHHPSIVRAVYVDNGASYKSDFLINLIAFSLRLRNAGVDDHGILVHLSEVIAGSLYGEGHSTIYDERDVYLLSIRSLLEPPTSLTSEMTRSEPILNPFRAKQRLNPFYLPWGMRGIADEILARGDQVLIKELERLKRLYIEWNPVTKAMKEIKFRLEPVRSKL